MTEQEKQELISGFGFVDFDNNKTVEPPPIDWQPIKEHEFSKGSLEVHRIVQERKHQKVELTKEESNRFLETLINTTK